MAKFKTRELSKKKKNITANRDLWHKLNRKVANIKHTPLLFFFFFLRVHESQIVTTNYNIGYHSTFSRFAFERSCLWPLAEIAGTGDQVLIAAGGLGQRSYQIDTNPMPHSVLYFNRV